LDQILGVMKVDKVFYSNIRSLLQLPVSGGSTHDLSLFISILGSAPIEREKFSALALQSVASISAPPTLPVKKRVPMKAQTTSHVTFDLREKNATRVVPTRARRNASKVIVHRKSGLSSVQNLYPQVRTGAHEKDSGHVVGARARPGKVQSTRDDRASGASADPRLPSTSGQRKHYQDKEKRSNVAAGKTQLAQPVTRGLLAGLRNNPSVIARRARLLWRDSPAIKSSEWTQVGETVLPESRNPERPSHKNNTSTDDVNDVSSFNSSHEESSEISANGSSADLAWTKDKKYDSHSSYSSDQIIAGEAPAESAWGPVSTVESDTDELSADEAHLESAWGQIGAREDSAESAWDQTIADEAPAESAWGRITVDSNSSADDGSNTANIDNQTITESDSHNDFLDTRSVDEEESAIADETPAESAWASAKNFESDDD